MALVRSWTLSSRARAVPAHDAVATCGSASPEQLMEAFLDGDDKAFEQLFRALAPRVASALVHMCRDPRLAEDLTQVTFMKLFRARHGYRRGMSVAPWAFTIARNAYLDHLRRGRRRAELLSTDGVLPEVASAATQESGACSDPNVSRLLDALPESQRQTLLLLKVQGLSVAEVAALSGTSEASVKMRAHRAYQRLRAVLEQEVRS